MIIYKITNLINQKIYIGQTIRSIKERWAEHCKQSNHCRYLKHAIQHYGKINFKIEQIDSADTIESLNVKETFWINFYNCRNSDIGYNISGGGDGKESSLETRKLMSDIRKETNYMRGRTGILHHGYGKKCSEETIEKMKKGWEARRIARSTIPKISKAKNPLSEKTKNKMKEKAIGRKVSNIAHEKSKKAREYVKSRGWSCNLPTARQRLIREVIKLLAKIQKDLYVR